MQSSDVERSTPGTVYADGATVKNLSATEGATVTLHAQWRPAQVQTKTFVIGGVEVTATLTGSDERIDGLVVGIGLSSCALPGQTLESRRGICAYSFSRPSLSGGKS
ncbi:MAG: hypothetical protein WAY93_10120 [Atopobiaceae bacterium]|jgi:hypothetical protein